MALRAMLAILGQSLLPESGWLQVVLSAEDGSKSAIKASRATTARGAFRLQFASTGLILDRGFPR